MPSEWELLGRLALTLALSATIGLERELRQKSAGLRTYTLVGVGAALFSLAGRGSRRVSVGKTNATMR